MCTLWYLLPLLARLEKLMEDGAEHIFTTFYVHCGNLSRHSPSEKILPHVLTTLNTSDPHDLDALWQQIPELPNLPKANRLQGWSGKTSKTTA